MPYSKPTYSEIVYLFADRFTNKRSLIVHYDKHPSGEKISLKSLSELMVFSAVIYLKENNLITLSVKDVRKMLVLWSKDVFVLKNKEAPRELTGIERKLLSKLSGEMRLQDLIYNLLNRNETLHWTHFIDISKNSLVEKGYLNVKEEKRFMHNIKDFSFGTDRLGALETEYSKVKNSLDAFILNTEEYQLVTKRINSGIALREYRDDYID
ncbi:hypothetical protein ACFL0C_01925 [Patescibacteria group bacterium]